MARDRVRAGADASGATVAASASGARAIEKGEATPDDPQYAFGLDANRYPPVAGVRVVADGETLRVGDLAITAEPVTDKEACRAYAEGARQRLRARVAEETSSAPAAKP